MDFKFNDEQELLQNMFKEFVEQAVQPVAAELDENEHFPEELIPQMAEIGMLGIAVPEDFGGVGMGCVETAMAVEEVSKACASTGITMAIHSLFATAPILKYGSDEQKEKYLPPLATGEKLGAFALTEPNAGSDAKAQRTVAEDKGDHYLINGNKVFITNGNYADIYVVIAATDKSKGKDGLSAFIIEKGTEGFTFGTKEKKMGIRGSATYELIFDNVKVPKENLLGDLGQGFAIAMDAIDSGRIGIAAQALGIAQGAIDETVKYVKERSQFGQTIAFFQNTKFTLAELQTKVDAARLLVYRAAWLMDNNMPFKEEAAMAKLFASETASAVTSKAVQLFGGYGYTRDYPVERMMRDAKITEIFGGTSEIQKVVISKEMDL